MDLAIHFFRLGYEVQFADLLGQAQYDLLVSKGEHELEVECKRKSIDAGRKIKKGEILLSPGRHLLCRPKNLTATVCRFNKILCEIGSGSGLFQNCSDDGG